ncbi:FRG domain-containing protein [Salinibacterium sp. ZJ70]|uniref:FRG domain-containing protein n=1 Tax=Salinibacterium sp. ZJ70 TaxID=2708084 RepID=UPI001422B6C8|nr:FRG domain-containing protein [Salinibacterium sp. ZJ70]
MSDATRFFEPWEQASIANWQDFQAEVNELTARYEGHRLVWRGVRDASWGVHSSLSRALRQVYGRYPTENEMVAAEKESLRLAREDWRFDGVPALELLAQLQHFGGPTRLLDVSENPLIALWFATEEPRKDEAENDGRVLAFVAPTTRDIHLNDRWNGRNARWHSLTTDFARVEKRWGTGLGRSYWRPPTYHGRIGSQSAGFLLDGVPLEGARGGLGQRSPEIEEAWTAAEMREFASIPMKLTHIRRGNLAADSAPVFTYRLKAGAKPDIRHQLQVRYSLRASSIYSDMFGLAAHLASRPELLARG